MEIYFEKISVNKELPKKTGEYITNIGEANYHCRSKSWDWCGIPTQQVVFWMKEIHNKKQNK
jgi:hypothetical protein